MTIELDLYNDIHPIPLSIYFHGEQPLVSENYAAGIKSTDGMQHVRMIEQNVCDANGGLSPHIERRLSSP